MSSLANFDDLSTHMIVQRISYTSITTLEHISSAHRFLYPDEMRKNGQKLSSFLASPAQLALSFNDLKRGPLNCLTVPTGRKVRICLGRLDMS